MDDFGDVGRLSAELARISHNDSANSDLGSEVGAVARLTERKFPGRASSRGVFPHAPAPDFNGLLNWIESCQTGVMKGLLTTLCLMIAVLLGSAIAAQAFDETSLKKLKALNGCNGCDLSGANLKGADLRGAKLNKAKLNKANLTGANLELAFLRGANLYGAYLRSASLSYADLEGANFSKADLRSATLKGANLTDADLTKANLSGADLTDAKLKNARIDGATFCKTKTPWGLDNSGCPK